MVPLDGTDHLRPRGVFIGPEMSFGHRIAAARPNESVAILKMAVNGTNLGCDWHPEWVRELSLPQTQQHY